MMESLDSEIDQAELLANSKAIEDQKKAVNKIKALKKTLQDVKTNVENEAASTKSIKDSKIQTLNEKKLSSWVK